MTSLNRIRVLWNGTPGGAGVSTFYSLDTATVLESLHTMFNSIKLMIPPAAHIVIAPSGDVIDSTTGAITGAWSGAPQAEVVGSAGADYAGPTGAVLNWGTSTILDGRRLRGRTFIVPLAHPNFVGGHLDAGSRGLLEAAAREYVIEQSASAVIWHRPYAGRVAGPGVTAKAAHGGGHGLITSALVPSLVAVLRSRRD